jgi:uncharacterized protein YciI
VEYFAVLTVHGPGWDGSKAIRSQQGWNDHAAVMDGLVESGFIVMGGPLDDGEQALLVVEAASEEEVRQLLAFDPWSPAHMEMLVVHTVQRWSIWLDGRSRAPSE